MMRGICLLEDGFEETEAISTHDILTRTHEIELDMVSCNGRGEVQTSMGLIIKCKKCLEEVELKDYEFCVLPGGKRGVDNLKANGSAMNAIKSFIKEGKPVYAICAAPSILGELGYLDGKSYTCFPGFQVGKGNYIHTGSVVDGNLITGHSMFYTIEFAENIVKSLLGEEALDRIAQGTKGLR